MANLLNKNNKHLFLEKPDKSPNSFVANMNSLAKSFRGLTSEEVLALKDIPATIVSLGEEWKLILEETTLDLLAGASAFNTAIVTKITEDVPANSEIVLPDIAKYVVGTNMLMLSYNGTVCYLGEQFEEVGEPHTDSDKIRILFDLRTDDVLEFRVVALNANVSNSAVIAEGSTEPRVLSERFNDIINVKDFGAKGDNTTDDTAAFQAARDHAKDRCVFVPSGVYKLTTHIEGLFLADGDVEIVGAELDVFRLDQHTIAKIRAANFEDRLNPGRFFTHSITTNETAVEGMAVGDGFLYFSLISPGSDATAVIVKVDMTTRQVVSSVSHSVTLGHANSIAYHDGSLYVAAYPDHTLVKLSADTLAVEKVYDLGYSCFGIAYDAVRGEFAALLGGGPLIRFLDKDFKTLHTVKAPVDVYAESASQGIAYHDGIVFLSVSAQDAYEAYVENVSSIVACDRNGKLLKTWRLGGTMGELEDIEVHDGRFLLCFNFDFKQVAFWQARFLQEPFHGNQHLTSEQVGEYAGVVYPGGGTITLYADASAVDGGVGTEARPFSRLKDAFAFIERFPYPYQIELRLTGDFSAEGVVYLVNVHHRVVISGGTMASFGAFFCKYVQLNGVTFTDANALGKYAIYAEHSELDVRSCILKGATGNNGIYVLRSTLYLLMASTFSNFDAAVIAETSMVWLYSTQSYSACSIKIHLSKALCHSDSVSTAEQVTLNQTSTVLIGGASNGATY